QEQAAIVSIPDSILLNTRTIPKSFKEKYSGLNSVQCLTLYLARNCPYSQGIKLITTEPDSFFGPYLDSLPKGFPDVPLTWALKAVLGDLDGVFCDDDKAIFLLEDRHEVYDLNQGQNRPEDFSRFMSQSTAKACDKVTLRFIKDWKALAACFRGDSLIITVAELLWAWLVGKSCVWYDLGCENHCDNITLAPVIDMANHTIQSDVTLIVTPQTLTMFSSHPRGLFKSPKSQQLISSSLKSSETSSSKGEICFKKDQEIRFSYGPHGNSTLLAEYGFVVLDETNPWDFIDITDSIEILFEKIGEDGNIKREMLQNLNYWGEYTVQCNPVNPSHRVLVALRLLHTPLKREAQWLDHAGGNTDDMGSQTECLVSKSLKEIFEDIEEQLVQTSKSFDYKSTSDSNLISKFAFDCLSKIVKDEMNAVRSFLNDHM
ncbi:hypothetical protein PPACK8108_LOCUS23081, partial [Phakopsora pachyrhizi]